MVQDRWDLGLFYIGRKGEHYCVSFVEISELLESQDNLVRWNYTIDNV